MRAAIPGALLITALSASSALAYDAYDPNNCNGLEWDDKRMLTVAKVTAQPRVNFIKSPYDDDFKAATCPATTDACRKKAYLVAGDLVLVGKVKGDFACVTYQSPLATKQVWAKGWLPRAALTDVTAMRSPAPSDWLGAWIHPGGIMTIAKLDGGKLKIDGNHIVPTARDVNNGALNAQVMPKDDTVAIVDDGSKPFDIPNASDECRVRIQRIGLWLLIEDNNDCGGAGVTFTGLYRRK